MKRYVVFIASLLMALMVSAQEQRKFSPEKFDAGCANAIKERDKCNLELRQIEQNYHQKMLKVLSASKLYDVINAETHFYRKMMKGWQTPPPPFTPKDKLKDRRF